MSDVTRILAAIEDGDAHAAERLLPLVYGELRRLAAEIRASEWSGNPQLLEAEARRALATAEQLEMALAKSARSEDRVRSSTVDEIPDRHREIVADYYRRLGEAGSEPDAGSEQ